MRKYYILSLFLIVFCSSILKAQTYSNWYTLGSGTSGSTPTVRAIVLGNLYSDSIYVGGDFTAAGGIKAGHIAIWTDTNRVWDTLSNGTNNEVSALIMYNKKLIAGGKFDSAGRIKTNHIASWNGVKWDSISGGLNGNVYSLCVYQDSLYAGGDFTMANGIKANRIAVWNGTKWDSVGHGFDSTVFALTTFNDTLYAGGAFTKSNGAKANYIAKWDGVKWDSISTGMNNIVYALDSFYYNNYPNSGPALYAGGAFTIAGGTITNHISVWTPFNKWNSLGPGTNDTVRALTIGHATVASRIKSGNAGSKTLGLSFLMVGGSFTEAGNLKTPYFAVWCDTSWFNLGYVNKSVFALASENSTVGIQNYIGGEFDSAASYIAKLQVIVGSGINELSNKSSIGIYPNPSNGVFTLQIRNYQLGIRNQIEIYNELGENIYTKEFLISNSQFLINLEGQPSGIYLCRVLAENGNLIGSEKIIIQR